MAADSFLLVPTASRTSRDYWHQSKQPLTCLVFVLPLLIGYEVGVWLLGGAHSEALRNGADFWLRDLLRSFGADQPFLLPLLLVGSLLAWHLLGKFPWRVSAETLVGMAAECVVFAFGLVVLAQVQDVAFRWWTTHGHTLVPGQILFGQPDPVSLRWLRAAQVVAFLGAGIYEEVLFRLLLLPLCYFAFRLLLLPGKWAAPLAILSTSLLFAAAHYVGASGEPFVWSTFAFRTLAGAFFAVLFVSRGFGVTVGTHALYDLLVGVVLVGTV